MAATAIVQGVLREIWRESVPQAGGPPQVVTTGIKASLATLARLRASLTIEAITGAPAVSATPSLDATGHIVITVANPTMGSSILWTLDVELTHSSQQANDLNGVPTIQIAMGVLSTGFLPETLAQAYAVGASDSDQRMIITNADGGGVTIDASTAGVTGDGVSLEIRQHDTHAVPFVINRRSASQALGPKMNFDRARGTYAVPTDVVQDDLLGAIDFYGRLGGTPVWAARIVNTCTSVAGAVLDSAIDFYTARDSAVAGTWRMSLNGPTAGLLTGYGNCGIMPSADNVGFIGEWASSAWQTMTAYSFFARANVCIGIDTTGANAHHTLCMAVANTVLPAASVGLVHVYAGELGNTVPDAPAALPDEAGSALSWSQAGEVSLAGAFVVPDRLIPVMVNGTAYWLMAVQDIHPE